MQEEDNECVIDDSYLLKKLEIKREELDIIFDIKRRVKRISKKSKIENYKLFNSIYNKVPFLNREINKLKEFIYCIINDIKTIKCFDIDCSNDCVLYDGGKNTKLRYKKYCSIDCRNRNKKEIVKQLNNTNLKLYKTTSNRNSHIINFNNYNIEYIKKHYIIDKTINIIEICKYFNINESSCYKFLKKNNIKNINLNKYENYIYQYLLKSFPNLNILFRNRKILNGLELDLFIPDYNIAIEFDGIYWHSYCEDNSKNKCSKQDNYLFQKNRHLNKSILCKEKKILLIHINENNLISRLEYIKYLILNNIDCNQIFNFKQEIIEVNLDYENDNNIDLLLFKHVYCELPSSDVVLKNRLFFNSGKLIYKRIDNEN